MENNNMIHVVMENISQNEYYNKYGDIADSCSYIKGVFFSEEEANREKSRLEALYAEDHDADDDDTWYSVQSYPIQDAYNTPAAPYEVFLDDSEANLWGVRFAVNEKKMFIRLVNLGEGYYGEYDPENRGDENLLRFDVVDETVMTDGEGEMLESRCTNLVATATIEQQQLALILIMEAIKGKPDELSQVCDRMSWLRIDPDGKVTT